MYVHQKPIKAKFHYASWFEAGRRQVRSGAGRRQVQSLRPASNPLRTSFEPDSVMEFGFEPVCDQLRTNFEPGSVMEFGF